MSDIRATAEPRTHGKVTVRIQLVDWYPDDIRTLTRHLSNQAGLTDPALSSQLTRIARLVQGAVDRVAQHRSPR